jgi:uncharacterized BrkB/YihY/UPF0761 family membrane protein
VLKGFRANQGLLLAGAVAYYALLSLVPLLILVMIVLSHAIDPERLLSVLTEYLAFVIPGRSIELVDELRRFVEHRHVLLLGAQVIAEYERVGHEPIDAPPEPLRTERAVSSGPDG